jgi:hypothetical protein
MAKEIEARTRGRLRVTVRQVPAIEREASGKIRLIHSILQPNAAGPAARRRA